jgi:hypothetical protein
MEYKCDYCNFNTKKKYNYDKHLQSNKHKLIESKTVVTPKTTQSQQLVIPESTQTPPNSANLFECKYCEQKFKFKQSMYRHIKYTCTKNKTEDLTELVRLLNLQLEQQKNQLEHKDKQLETQTKQIEKLMDKLEINNTYNTNNTINVTNNINLLNYKDTDMSHITDLDYRKCLKNLNRCVIKLIEKVHFNPEKPENMNMYISNIKNNHIMLYKDDKWILTEKDELKTIYDDKEYLIGYWLEDHPNEDELIKIYNKYMDNKTDKLTMKELENKLKLLMFNNKSLVLKQKNAIKN